MLRFFRRLRKKMLAKGKFRSFLVYALGEIVLIVVGILLALQFNDWREKATQEKEFCTLLEQIYNDIHEDTEIQFTSLNEIQIQIKMIQTLLHQPDSIDDRTLLPYIAYLETYMPSTAFTRANHLLPFLDYNTGNDAQKELMKQLVAYGYNSPFKSLSEPFIGKELLGPFLSEHGIPKIQMTYLHSFDAGLENFNRLYEEEDTQIARKLIEIRSFRAALKTLQSDKEYMFNAMSNDHIDGLSILKLIKDYHADVQLLYDDVGIIGDALENGWGQSVPMQRLAGQKSIWELEIELKDGYIKFRNRNSWNQNWGGTQFPKGRTMYFGDNIPVKAGNYLVRLNLEESSYDFIRK